MYRNVDPPTPEQRAKKAQQTMEREAKEHKESATRRIYRYLLSGVVLLGVGLVFLPIVPWFSVATIYVSNQKNIT
jgi:cell division septal protein FtsQ